MHGTQLNLIHFIWAVGSIDTPFPYTRRADRAGRESITLNGDHQIYGLFPQRCHNDQLPQFLLVSF